MDASVAGLVLGAYSDSFDWSSGIMYLTLIVPLLLDYLVASVNDVTLACYQWRSRSGALICVQLHGSEWHLSFGLIYEDLTVQQHEAVKME